MTSRCFSPINPGPGVNLSVTEPVPPLDACAEKVRRSRTRGAIYPYELVPQLTGTGGTFTEYDLGAAGQLVPVERAPGRNAAGIIVAVVCTPPDRYPEGMRRVALFGDPTKVIAALDLAEQMKVPVEWFPLSSGAESRCPVAPKTWAGSPAGCAD